MFESSNVWLTQSNWYAGPVPRAAAQLCEWLRQSARDISPLMLQQGPKECMWHGAYGAPPVLFLSALLKDIAAIHHQQQHKQLPKLLSLSRKVQMNCLNASLFPHASLVPGTCLYICMSLLGHSSNLLHELIHSIPKNFGLVILDELESLTLHGITCTAWQHSWGMSLHYTGNCETCIAFVPLWQHNTLEQLAFCAAVQGQTQGQLDKLQEESNHWTFLTGATVASLPIHRSASMYLFCMPLYALSTLLCPLLTSLMTRFNCTDMARSFLPGKFGSVCEKPGSGWVNIHRALHTIHWSIKHFNGLMTSLDNGCL